MDTLRKISGQTSHLQKPQKNKVLCNKYGKRNINENYKRLEREIEDNIRRWKVLPCLWIRIKVARMTYY
jgi:cell fate (sporulation/competence/biofilm development) regulator YmcA (YheA/YmcA/DUF963 family)